jgi:hypothetical protein
VKAITKWIKHTHVDLKSLVSPSPHIVRIRMRCRIWPMGAQRIRGSFRSSHNWFCAMVVRSVGYVWSLAHLPYLSYFLTLFYSFTHALESSVACFPYVVPCVASTKVAHHLHFSVAYLCYLSTRTWWRNANNVCIWSYDRWLRKNWGPTSPTRGTFFSYLPRTWWK